MFNRLWYERYTLAIVCPGVEMAVAVVVPLEPPIRMLDTKYDGFTGAVVVPLEPPIRMQDTKYDGFTGAVVEYFSSRLPWILGCLEE